MTLAFVASSTVALLGALQGYFWYLAYLKYLEQQERHHRTVRTVWRKEGVDAAAAIANALLIDPPRIWPFFWRGAIPKAH